MNVSDTTGAGERVPPGAQHTNDSVMNQKGFANNYSDLSDGSGFQFEFYCERCHDAWRTDYDRYAAGTASSILDTASSFLGGFLGSAGTVVDRVRDSGYRSARDKAFEGALGEAEEHFNKCRRCANYFCAQCYNPNMHMCTNCAPTVEEEANIAARHTEIDMARTRAEESVRSGGVKTDDHINCPSCGARVKPGKFCGECGAQMQTKKFCSECGTEVQPGAKFCPDCGTKQ